MCCFIPSRNKFQKGINEYTKQKQRQNQPPLHPQPLSLPVLFNHSSHLFQIHTLCSSALLSISLKRMALSNNIISILNFVAFLCSIPIIASGIFLASKPDSACLHLARWPIIILGLLILLVSLAGFIGSHWNHQCLLATYLFAMAVLIVVLLAFIVAAFVVTHDDGSYAVPGRDYKEYRVDGYSRWLRRYVVGNWEKVKVCLIEENVCEKAEKGEEYYTAQQYFQTDLLPIQSGCCKPPTVCGYSYVNPMVWINPANPAADPDCNSWSNDQSQLCYNCNSCKGGTLGNIRKEWRKANIILIVAAVVLIFVYVIGCCAFRNAQTEDMFRRYKQGWV